MFRELPRFKVMNYSTYRDECRTTSSLNAFPTSVVHGHIDCAPVYLRGSGEAAGVEVTIAHSAIPSSLFPLRSWDSGRWRIPSDVTINFIACSMEAGVDPRFGKGRRRGRKRFHLLKNAIDVDLLHFFRQPFNLRALPNDLLDSPAFR